MQSRRPQFDSWVGTIHWRSYRLSTPVFLSFPCGSAGKESTCNVRDTASIPGLGRSPRGRLPTPVFWPEQVHGLYSPWGSQRVRHDWVTFTLKFIIARFTKWSQVFTFMTHISHIDLTFAKYLICNLEKAMAPHSSTLAWKILWTKEPGRLQSMGSLRVGYD